MTKSIKALRILLLLVIGVLVVIFFYQLCTQEHNYRDWKGIAPTPLGVRATATALETYYVDNNSYPPMEEDCTLPKALTTPIAYLNSLPEPVSFCSEKGIGDLPLRYFSIESRNLWILQNCGPDGDYDLTEYHLIQMINERETEYSYFMKDCYYDPTNGIDSNGDIFRVRQ